VPILIKGRYTMVEILEPKYLLNISPYVNNQYIISEKQSI